VLLSHQAPDQRIRDDLTRVVKGEPLHGFVRSEILASWQRSIAAGLHRQDTRTPFEALAHRDEQLLAAGLPVVECLAGELHGTDITVVLSDAEVRVVARNTPSVLQGEQLDAVGLSVGHLWSVDSVGTTALGIASSTGCASMVIGAEHFMDAMCDMTTASAPIHDPRARRVVGALTLVCPAVSTNSLLLPVTQRCAREIADRLSNTIAREQVPEMPDGRTRRHDLRTRRRPAFGWASLTEAERCLTQLIADGLTNKQAAARLFVSRHTVDSHLRHIFRKLDINSRVELARLVAMQSFAHASA
jgi:transcriptional regulator of acetoin/glycerol metabolism